MRSSCRIPVDCNSSVVAYTSAIDDNNPVGPNRKLFCNNALRHFYVPFVDQTEARTEDAIRGSCAISSMKPDHYVCGELSCRLNS